MPEPQARAATVMHDTPPRVDPVLNLARIQMESVTDIHLTHLAIVSGRDETQVLQFRADNLAAMLAAEIPSLVREILALGVIFSSPATREGRYGAVVTLIDRTLEAFYVPIVKIINADDLVGDFRPTSVEDPKRYERIRTELRANWAKRGNR
jgi:hypothetical protein